MCCGTTNIKTCSTYNAGGESPPERFKLNLAAGEKKKTKQNKQIREMNSSLQLP